MHRPTIVSLSSSSSFHGNHIRHRRLSSRRHSFFFLIVYLQNFFQLQATIINRQPTNTGDCWCMHQITTNRPSRSHTWYSHFSFMDKWDRRFQSILCFFFLEYQYQHPNFSFGRHFRLNIQNCPLHWVDICLSPRGLFLESPANFSGPEHILKSKSIKSCRSF